MSWHAVDAVDDAVEATRRFLFPFSLVRWTKLALLVLLMGGGVSTNASVPVVPDAEFTTFPEAGPGTVVTPDDLSAVDPGLLAAVAAGIILAAVVFSVFSLSLRLVFYDALRTNEVRLWRPFLARLRQALGLFVFSTILSLVAALPIAIAVLVSVAGDDPIGWGPIDSLAAAIGSLSAAIGSLSAGSTVALGLVGGVLVLVGVLALRFTYEFVVPTMIVEETGVIAGWERFSMAVRDNWTDILVYLVVHFVIGVGLSIVEALAIVIVGAAVVVIAGLVLLIVAVPLGGLGALVGTTVGVAALAFVTVVALVALLVVVVPVRVVTRSYRIVYEVSTLGGIDPTLALLHPDTNPAVSSTATAAPPENGSSNS